MRLSVELRKEIFCHLILRKDAHIVPKCGDAPVKKEEDREIKRNPTSDLMTLNKTICSEIAIILYEERTFAIHVHEGIRNGGIELLETGRQKLQYLDELSDKRFTRFISGESFGFDRLKKIEVFIYPSSEEDRLSRHVPINTYFMNLALCKLLDRGDGNDQKKNRIDKLTIMFMESERPSLALTAGQTLTTQAESYWWDTELKKPRETSIHRLSNVEIALRPFCILKSHKLEVKLPPSVRLHDDTVAFVEKLEGVITSNGLGGVIDDLSTAQIEAAREAMQDHVFSILYNNGKHTNILGLNEEELCEDEHIKRQLSPRSKVSTSPSKRNKADERFDDELYDLNDKDWQSAWMREEMEMQLAIQASLNLLNTESSAASIAESPAAGCRRAGGLQCREDGKEVGLAWTSGTTQNWQTSSAQDPAAGSFCERDESSDELHPAEMAILSSNIAQNYTLNRLNSSRLRQPIYSDIPSSPSIKSALCGSPAVSDMSAPPSINLWRRLARCEKTTLRANSAQDGSDHEIKDSPTMLLPQEQTANEGQDGNIDHSRSAATSTNFIREPRRHNFEMIPRTLTEQEKDFVSQAGLSRPDSRAFRAGVSVQGENGANDSHVAADDTSMEKSMAADIPT